MRVRPVLFAGVLAAATIASLAVARADEVTDQINEAVTAYQKKDLATTIAALDAAANLVRQARADMFKVLLPEPLAGWTADESDTNVVAAPIMGGGITAARKYHKGDDHVEIEIMADSPVAQSMAAVLNSPLMAMGGARQVVIGGKRMAYMKDDNAYMTMVADRALVKVSGNRGVPEDVLKAYVAALNLGAIEKTVRQ